MDIEYDPAKAASNLKKHGVSFDEASTVFADAFAVEREDTSSVDERRFLTLGMGLQGRVLMVVWTPRGNRIRLISAWKANKPQRNRYGKQF